MGGFLGGLMGGGGGALDFLGPIGLVFSGLSALQGLMKPSGQANVQAPVAPPASQAAITPDQPAFKKGVATGDPTLLTGPQGVPDDKLTLGKPTILGS